MKEFIYIVLLLVLLVVPIDVYANFELNLNNGIASYHDKNYEEAIDFFNKALSENENNPTANHFIGLSYFQLQDFDNASKYFIKAKDIDPNIKNIDLDLGSTYIKLGKYDDAVNELNTHLEKNPDSGLGYYYLGYSQFALGDYKQAIDSFERSKELDKSFAVQSNYYQGVSFYLDNSFEEAKRSFSSVIELAPEHKLTKSSAEYIDIINRFLKNYYANFTFGYQYDTNVALEPDDIKIVSDESDSSLFLYLNLGYKPYFTKDSVIGLDYKTFFNFHNDLDNFNVQNHKFSIYGEKDVNNFSKPLRAFLNYSYELVFIDGSPADELFSQSHSITPGFTIRWSDKTSSRIYYSLQYDDFEDFSERDAFNNSLTWAQYYKYMDGKLIISPGLKFELNSADDISGKRNYSFWSPEISLEALASLPHRTNFYSRLYYSYEDYYDDEFDRKDNQIGFKALISKHVYKFLYVDLAYELLYNNSSSDFPGGEPFDYNRNVFTIGLSFKL